MNKKRTHIFLAAFTLVVLTSCATTIFTGRRQLLLYSDDSISSLSDKSYSEYMSSVKLSSNSTMSSMVKTVGNTMVSALTKYLKSVNQSDYLNGLNWDFKLIADTTVNAFCLPNGKIVLYDGITKFANTADYLAVVIGHEMGHAVARHGNERMSQQQLVSATGEIVRTVYAGTNAGNSQEKLAIFDAVFGVGANLGLILPYSRKHEYEADQIGLYIMSIAGYNVYQAPKFWQKMTAATNSSAVDFMSTHPSDAKRIANINAVIAQMEKND